MPLELLSKVWLTVSCGVLYVIFEGLVARDDSNTRGCWSMVITARSGPIYFGHKPIPASREESIKLKPAWEPGDPCPDLLTDDEAIRYLRLHEIEIKNPGETLQR